MNAIGLAMLLGFPLYFFAVWFFVLKLLSVMSGWRRLAERYQTAEPFEGKFFRRQSGRLKQVKFNGAIDVGVNKTGLYLVPMVLFRPFHKPLLIPWGEIQVEPVKKFMFQGQRLSFQSFPGITLELPNRTFDKMIGYLQAQTAAAPPAETRAQ